MTRVIVVGNNNLNDYALLREKLDYILSDYKDIVVVTDVCRETDQLAERYAEEKGYKTERMTGKADILVAFWDGEDMGIRNMIEMALKKGLAYFVVKV